jgi:hypothetical protein
MGGCQFMEYNRRSIEMKRADIAAMIDLSYLPK